MTLYEKIKEDPVFKYDKDLGFTHEQKFREIYCPLGFDNLIGHFDEEEAKKICEEVVEDKDKNSCFRCWSLQYIEEAEKPIKETRKFMTLKEKVAEIMPAAISTEHAGGVKQCPCDYEFLTGHYDRRTSNLLCKGVENGCEQCWGLEYIEDLVTDINVGNKSDNVNHPNHYQGKHECIDIMIAMFGKQAVIDFCKCNILKYRWRAEKKSGEEDIKKAEWYETKLLELEGK